MHGDDDDDWSKNMSFPCTISIRKKDILTSSSSSSSSVRDHWIYLAPSWIGTGGQNNPNLIYFGAMDVLA
jgi:hypothetical protein